jgi:hypothetical protein
MFLEKKEENKKWLNFFNENKKNKPGKTPPKP